ncbi:MAG: hypothetical protein IJB74_08880 [Clostridia bacterium]|nr:hypothetical protein [Clostridia bacterium]
MAHNIIGALICALAGFIVALVNYLLSKRILETRPEKFAFSAVARQVIQIGYLVTVFFIGSRLTVNLTFLLVGAVLGMTVPMIFFTKKLLSFNESAQMKPKAGEEENDGGKI